MSYNFSSKYLDEIVINILTRLPIESLSRFKRVCKLWHYTISHPNFLKRETLFFMSLNKYTFPSVYSIDAQSFIESCPIPWKQKKPWKDHEFDYRQVFISNSCDGLVLIGLDTNLFLLNPSINYFIKVLELERLRDDGYVGYSVTAGFCYDHSINDYKAVLGLVHESPDYGGKFVIVASLRTKRWKQFSFPFDLASADAGPVINGQMHWTVRDPSKGRFSTAKKIIHFDSRSNIFEEFLMPRPKHGDENRIVGLGVLDGRLCMARGDEMGNDNKFQSIEVLVMKEYGVVESWATLFLVSNMDLMVNLYYGWLAPLMLTENGEVFLKINNEKLVLYNYKRNSYRILQIPEKFYRIAVVSLDVSLVTATGCKWSRRKHRRLGSKIKRLRRS